LQTSGDYTISESCRFSGNARPASGAAKREELRPAIPNLKILALSEVMVFWLFQTVLEFFTNKRMLERKFAYS